MAVKKSVSFPDDLYETIKAEAERQQLVFNRVVTSALREKYNPDSYDADALNVADGKADGMREINEEDVSNNIKEVKILLSEADISRLKAFAKEAGLPVSELIRQYARYGKVEHKEVVIEGHRELMHEMLELRELLESEIMSQFSDAINDSTLAIEVDKTANALIKKIDEFREKTFKKLERINKKGGE